MQSKVIRLEDTSSRQPMTRVLTLTEAAVFLHITPEGLRKKAIKGEIPGAKIGKRWCFLENDLVECIRSFYPSAAKTSWGVTQTNRRTLWHSTKEKISGGLVLATVDKEYSKLLARKIK
jgi:excisionase family DNA binding protein